MDRNNEFIRFMEEAGVLTFGDFTTKSGRKTPYFINAGLYRTGAHISRLGDFYADTISQSGEDFDVLYGPAYKGIPLAAAAASSLYRNYGRDVPYAFNRKETKTHGEGGIIIGQTPKNGDRIAVIEDVTTAGTSIRETAALFRDTLCIDVQISALYVSVDRMERGTGAKTAFDELREAFGVRIYPIVTVREIIASLPENDERTAKMKAYLALWGA
jgi:orotate phosphoribosyltransferase